MSALIIIDVQNDFINGNLKFIYRFQTIIEKINELKKDKRFKLVILSQELILKIIYLLHQIKYKKSFF